jgi:S1-C subfamily serine protease
VRRALACAVALVVIAGCGGDDDDKPRAAVTETQTQRVEVVKAADDGFDPQQIYKTQGPGVVTLVALDRNAASARTRQALGSGFVVDANGYIATNAHVITGDSGVRAEKVYVQFADGNRLVARIVGADPDSDIGLVKIDPSELRGAKLKPLPFGSSSELQVGDPVAAIGSPFGEQQSLSIGVVSAVNRDIKSLTDFGIGNAIQTDAAINHGNSGGPLLDGAGKVIGVNSQIRSTGGGGEGVGFAVPVETVRRSVDQLRKKGRVDYAYLGISSVTLYPQLAERLGLDATTGALVDDVRRGGPADAAGIRGADDHITFQDVPTIPVGSDLIVAVEGRKLTEAQDLSDVIGVHQPGETVDVRVVRDGRVRTVEVKLGTRPRGQGDN